MARSRARKTAKDAGLSVANERKTRGKKKEEEKMREAKREGKEKRRGF